MIDRLVDKLIDGSVSKYKKFDLIDFRRKMLVNILLIGGINSFSYSRKIKKFIVKEQNKNRSKSHY